MSFRSITGNTFTPGTDNPVNPQTVTGGVGVAAAAGHLVVVASYQGTACSDSQGNSYATLFTDGTLTVFYSVLTSALTYGTDTITVSGAYAFQAYETGANGTTPVADYKSASGTATGPIALWTQNTPVLTIPAGFVSGSILILQQAHSTGDPFSSSLPQDIGSESISPTHTGNFGYAHDGNPVFFYGGSSVAWTTGTHPTGTIEGQLQGGLVSGRTANWSVFCLLTSDTDLSPPPPPPPPPPITGSGLISALRHYTNRLFEFKIVGGQVAQDLYDDADGNPARSTIDAATTCRCVAFWLVDSALEGTYLRDTVPIFARSTNHGSAWRLTSIPGTYDGLASAPYRNRFVVLGFHDAGWYARVGKYTAPGVYAWSAEVAVSLPFTPDGVGYLRVEDDNTLMLHARDTDGGWHLVRCHVLSLAAVGTWN